MDCSNQQEFCMQRFDRLERSIEEVKQCVHGIDILLRGNGQPGLRAQALEVERRVDLVEGDVANVRWMFKIGAILIVTLPVGGAMLFLLRRIMELMQ